MSGFKNKELDTRRRHLLLGGLALSATGLLQACGGGSSDVEEGVAADAQSSASAGSQVSLHAETVVGTVTTPAPIPSAVVNLADYGGVPGASGSTIISAFNQAFNQLKGLGGGTLKIGAGTYNLGSYANTTLIQVGDLKNVLISAYGAQFRVTTLSSQSDIRPTIFSFQNPNNVTVAGMSFYDSGTNLTIRSGATCINVSAQRKCSLFKTVDCVADNVVSYFRSDTKSYPYVFERFDINATVKNSYYGVTAHKSGRFSKANLNILNVRRAFISHSARDWDVNVKTQRTGGSGSNAHVVLCAFPDGPVMDCNVYIDASGALNGYGCLGEIIHQGPDGSSSYARNVKFNFNIHDASSAASTGVISFAAEPESGGGMRSTTVGSWENIQVKGTVSGSYGGRMVANPSVSSASTNSIYVASKVAAMQSMSSLPNYFHVISQCS